MRKFKDEECREWIVRVDTTTIRKARDRFGIDLDGILSDKEPLKRLADDVVLRVDVLWCCVEEQAKQKGITPDEFGQALYGDAIESATDALMEAIIDFFPRSRRDLLEKVWQKSKERATAEMERVNAIVEEFLLEKPLQPLQPMPESAQTA